MPPRIVLIAISFVALVGGASAQSIDELQQEVRRYADLVRVEVFDDIAAHGCEDAVRALDASIKMLETPVQRIRAIEACSAFAGAEAEADALELLLELALSKDTHHALVAARTLSNFRGANLDALERVVARGRSEFVRATALGALLPYWKVNPQAEHIRRFAENALVPYSGSERQLKRWLWTIEHPLVQETYPKLLTSRAVSNPNRALLVADLARRPEAIAEPMLWKVLTTTRKEDLQAMVLTQLATRSMEVRVDWLHKALEEGKLPELRYQAARMLARLNRGKSDWAQLLLDHAKSGNPTRQYISAAFAASTLEEQRFAILQTLLTQAEDTAVQSRVVESIFELEDGPLTGLLIEHLPELQSRARRDAQEKLVLLSERHDCETDEDWKKWWGEGRVQIKQAAFAYEKWRTQSEYNLRKTQPSDDFFGLDLAGQNVVFVLDASIAMSERLLVTRFEEETKLSYQKLVADVLKPSLESLVSKQRLGTVIHSEHVNAPEDKLVKWTENAAFAVYQEYMRQLPLGVGRTRLALQRAFDFEDADTIVLISGFGCREQMLDEYDLIVDEVDRLNRFRHLTIHTIALGQKNELLIELAQKHEGHYVLAR